MARKKRQRVKYKDKVYLVCGETDVMYFLTEKKDCTKKFAVKKDETVPYKSKGDTDSIINGGNN